METVRLVAHRRSETGKGPARRLRSSGQLPAVLYGHGASEAIAVDSKDLLLIRRSEAGANTIIDLAIDGEADVCSAILREVQIDPISRQHLHADFYRVEMLARDRVNLDFAENGTTHVCFAVNGEVNNRIGSGLRPTNKQELFTVDSNGFTYSMPIEDRRQSSATA